MKRRVLLTLMLLVITMFSGCSPKTQELSICETYVNGICVVSKTELVTICNEPLIINSITYCK